jgi:hypothetical protein
MSRKLSGPRSKANLSEVIEYRLKSYSIAAAAAGVSMLALGRPAQAEVVVTAKNLPVVDGEPVYIKMTGEGRADFELVEHSSSGFYTITQTWGITPQAGGEIVGVTPGASFYASRLLGPGVVVGPLSPFGGQGGALLRKYMRSSPGFCTIYYCFTSTWIGNYGFWTPSGSAYIGVRFPIDGRIHYGWIRFSVYPSEITAYGYETEPDTPLIVPPASSDDTYPNTGQEDHSLGEASVGGPSLGMLALGAHGVALWRRKETLAF